jgi:hypothetical protein
MPVSRPVNRPVPVFGGTVVPPVDVIPPVLGVIPPVLGVIPPVLGVIPPVLGVTPPVLVICPPSPPPVVPPFPPPPSAGLRPPSDEQPPISKPTTSAPTAQIDNQYLDFILILPLFRSFSGHGVPAEESAACGETGFSFLGGERARLRTGHQKT